MNNCTFRRVDQRSFCRHRKTFLANSNLRKENKWIVDFVFSDFSLGATSPWFSLLVLELSIKFSFSFHWSNVIAKRNRSLQSFQKNFVQVTSLSLMVAQTRSSNQQHRQDLGENFVSELRSKWIFSFSFHRWWMNSLRSDFCCFFLWFDRLQWTLQFVEIPKEKTTTRNLPLFNSEKVSFTMQELFMNDSLLQTFDQSVTSRT